MNKNGDGDKTEPCFTPKFTVNVTDHASFHLTQALQPENQFSKTRTSTTLIEANALPLSQTAQLNLLSDIFTKGRSMLSRCRRTVLLLWAILYRYCTLKVDQLGGRFFSRRGRRFHDVGAFFITGAHNSCAGRRFYAVEKIAGADYL